LTHVTTLWAKCLPWSANQANSAFCPSGVGKQVVIHVFHEDMGPYARRIWWQTCDILRTLCKSYCVRVFLRTVFPGCGIPAVLPCSLPLGYAAPRAVASARRLLVRHSLRHYFPLPAAAVLVLAVLWLTAHRSTCHPADVGGVPRRSVDLWRRRSALCRQCVACTSGHAEQCYSSRRISAGWWRGTLVTQTNVNNPTNQLAVSQVADWSTRGLVNSPKCLILKFEYLIAVSVISGRIHYLYIISIR